MAAQDGPPDLSELRVREEAKAELLQELRDRDELAQIRDKRVRALLVSFVALAGVLVPFVGLVLGVTVRVFRWASGF
jgi:hypothetical protein